MKMKNYTLIIASLFLVSLVTAQSHTWNGNGGDLNWSNVANWDVGSIPNASSEVLIPDGFDVEIRISPASVNAIEIEGTGHLTIANSLTLGSEIFISLLSEITFEQGILSGGIIENSGTITLTGIGATRTFNNVIFNNAGLFLIIESNQTNLLDSTINNLSAGVINIPSNGGLAHQNTSSTLNNAGLLKKSQGNTQMGTYYLVMTINNTGTIEVIEDQTILMLASQYEYNNFEEGKMIGGGVYDITAMFTNMGTVYPGEIGGVGLMDVTNNFSLNDGTIEIDMEGKQAGEYDWVRVTGGADMTGTFDVKLSFAPEIDDEFVVLTSLFTFVNCNFPAETTASFNGLEYTFQTICNQNDVTLKVTEIEILGTEDFILNDANFFVQPNPVGNNALFVFSSEHLDFGTKDAVVKLYNLMGQEVYQLDGFSETNNTFIRGGLESGIYFAQLSSEEKVLATTKLVLK